MTIPDKVKSIMYKLIDNGFEAYIIGGAVRAIVLLEEPKDFDLFTNASGEEILKIFPHGVVIGGEERQKKILTVIVDGVEVSQYRANGDRTETGNSLKQHLSTCDLTINSMALDIGGNLIDHHEGRRDIQKKIIRAVGDPLDRLKEDKLRAFRAIRFAAKYGFNLHLDLMLAIQTLDLADIAPERIRDELMLILKHNDGVVALALNGLLAKLVPEWDKMMFLDGGPKHDEDIAIHSMQAFGISCNLTSNILLRLTCLLHDIGKVDTYNPEDGTFKGHDEAGAKKAREMLIRLKFSNNDINYVVTLIEHHLFSYGQRDLTKKAYIRLFNELGDIPIHDLVMLQYCDQQANGKNPRQSFLEFLKQDKILPMYYELKFGREPFNLSDLAINGNDVMTLGFQGKEIGAVLKAMFDEVMEGRLKNERPDLMAYAMNQRLIKNVR